MVGSRVFDYKSGDRLLYFEHAYNIYMPLYFGRVKHPLFNDSFLIDLMCLLENSQESNRVRFPLFSKPRDEIRVSEEAHDVSLALCIDRNL